MSTDYTDASWKWKLRKAARYVRLFGPVATLEKVRAAYHMDAPAVADRTPTVVNRGCSEPNAAERAVAIIGCGKFSYAVLARYLNRENKTFLRAALDKNLSRSLSLCRRYGGAYATTDFQTVLDDEQIRLVYIASNHASHAEYAIKCIEAGKAVHIEKPHVVTLPQLARLISTMATRPEVPVYLGFNRPKSPHFTKIVKALSTAPGPTAVNWFVAGHEIDESHWYYAPDEGGRVLGNLCHWLDASLHLIGIENVFPCELCPGSEPTSRNDFSLAIRCADGSLATICFSAKGHTFEGVREILSLQRSTTLVLLRDFEETRIDSGHRRIRYKTRWRSHGHGENVRNSYGALTKETAGETARYVLASGMISLAARESLESNRRVRLVLPDAGSEAAQWEPAELMEFDGA